eukprot:TRINITY_DN14881_c0_g1_i2.p1 TRINITY_DN14881_c0_g1~~TRINITY_DN14881_c0_g1_i2.p1  ORF type:complete len:107 (+),score=29.28 TRINITY_DN14881_c0_g1_i2:203-523(+)
MCIRDRAMNVQQKSLTEQEIDNWFSLVDENGDQEIELKEYQNLVLRTLADSRIEVEEKNKEKKAMNQLYNENILLNFINKNVVRDNYIYIYKCCLLYTSPSPRDQA